MPQPKAPSKGTAQRRKKPDEPATNKNGSGDEAIARARLAIPHVEVGEKVTHDTLYSPERLAAFDEADATRAERAAAILNHEGYEGALTGHHLRKLLPLLREEINPRYVVTTGPAQAGKPMVTTGIQSVQVQLDRLTEIVGAEHFRVIPWHTPDGVRCRVHVIVGNDLQWADVADGGELIPYTVLGGAMPADANTIRALLESGELVKWADIVTQQEGWGGHSRGSAPGDIWKGSYTNAAKLAIARVGPGHHVYLLDFEDDPHAPEARGVNRGGQGRARTTPAQQQAQADAAAQEASGEPVDHDKEIAAILAKDDDLKDLRRQAHEGMQAIGGSPARIYRTLAEHTTKAKLDDLIHRLNLMLDQDAAQEQLNVDGGEKS